MPRRLAALLLLLPALSSAQDGPSLRDLSFAAGYKAQFACSATFNAGKTMERIEADELANIYPDYAPAIAAVGGIIVNPASQTVSVGYVDGVQPRIAAYRPHLGCTGLPPGAALSDIDHLPKVDLEAPDHSGMSWPMGDMLPNDDGLTDMQRTALADTVDHAFAGDFGGVTSAVLVVKGGRIVAERYAAGFDHTTSQRTWSVAKSIGATVIGAAVQDGLIDIEAPTDLSAWSRPGDPRAAITTENLLHMASGLDSEPAGNRTDDVYFGGGLVAQHATDAALDTEPGTRWRYANNDTMLALRALRERMDSREDYTAYPFRALLHKIGMTRTVPETDWDGDFILSSQVWTTSRDLARLGLLYLDDGVWNDERILPEGWTTYVATPQGPQPYGKTRPEECHRGYGAQFWLYHDCDGVPEGTYAALGNRGQILVIVPQEDLVIVRRGYDYAGERLDVPVFIAAVMGSLK